MPSSPLRPAPTSAALDQTDTAVDLLSDLEERLGALRNWQSQSEAQAEQVRDRSRKLEDRQRDLDDQAEQLRRDRAAHEAALAALRDDRADADRRRSELEAELHAMAQAQAKLDTRKRDLEAHAAEVEQELDDKHRALEAEEHRRRDAAASVEQAADAKAADADARLRAAETKQADAARRLAELSEAQAKLDEARDLLADRIAAADQRDAELDARQARLDTVADALEAERAKLDERAADLEARAKDLDRVSDELDAELQKLTARQGDLEQAQQSLDERRDTLDRDLDAYRQAKLDQELRGEELEAREASLAKSRQKLIDEAGAGKLDAQARQQREAELAQKARELEALRDAHAAAAEQLHAAQQQAQSAHDELTHARVQLDGAQTLIAQRESELSTLRGQLDARVTELTDLRGKLADAQAHAQALEEAAQANAAPPQRDLPPAGLAPIGSPLNLGLPADPDPADDDAVDADLPTFTFGHQSESAAAAPTHAAAGLDKLQALVEQREIEIADLRSQLETQTQQLDHARAQVADLKARLEAAERAAAAAPHPDTETPDARAEELAATLAARDEQLDDARLDLDARAAEVKLLRERIDELTAQLEQADHFDDQAAADISNEEFSRRRTELDEQAAQIAADRQRVLERKAQLKQADEIIKQRREKIRQYAKLAREQAGPARPNAGFAAASPLAASDAARLAGLDKERAALAEVKLFLEQSEAAMVQRWATHKTASLVTSTVIAVILAVGFSFFVGSQLAQPLYRATMAVEVQPEGDASSLPPGAWLTDYKRTLLSPPVLSEALNQMDQRGVRVAGTAEQLDAHLREKLSATGNPSRVELAYFGDDTTEVGAVLEAYGRALMVHHMAEDRKAGRLSDTARILQPAVAEASPVQDDRLKYALATFAAIVAAATLLALPLRLLYGRSQRVLHENSLPQLAMLNERDQLAHKNPDDQDPKPAGIRNDGPPAGFARIPTDVRDDHFDNNDADEQPEQVFRF